MTVEIFEGDCRAVMALCMEPGSVDAIVTDPPYGLGFMGKGWDHGVPDATFWREMLRVAKPGAHMVAFGGTRTYHRMVCAIEDAGWEIRDCLMWVYGQGFPKSLDVAKAIDKARTEDAEPVRAICRAVRGAMNALGLRSKSLVEHFGNCDPRLIDHWAARDTDSQPSLPTWEQWEILRDVLKLGDALDAEVRRLNDRKGTRGEAWQAAEVIGEHAGETPGFGEHRFSVSDRLVRAPATAAARQWQGWGTAMKPAWEPVVVARKPLAGTVAANVQAHGTGALNIDGCRVSPGVQPHDLGRWPANVIHDGSDEVLAAFPEAPGQQADASSSSSRKSQNVYGAMKRGNGRDEEPSADSDNDGAVGFKMKPGARREDEGSAARFFYCAKATAKDREEGLADFTPTTTTDGRTTPIDNPYLRVETNRRNSHPTVKPTELMRWLCRLVTPKGGVVLDPFLGSGSTGKAAALEGFSFVGIEQEASYLDIARARIADAIKAAA